MKMLELDSFNVIFDSKIKLITLKCYIYLLNDMAGSISEVIRIY